MMQTGPEKVTMVALADIEVMNPRERNQRVYREIVENIRRIGELAKLMADAGLIVLSAFISPHRA